MNDIKQMLNKRGDEMATKKEQYEVRRWQILSIALDQFIQYGYYGTSTRKIAEAAGVSSGLMFHYFPNKQALYEALVEIGCEKMVLSDDKQDTPLKVFEKMIDSFLNLVKQNDFSTKMFVFMGLVAVNSTDVSEKVAELMKAHDMLVQSVPFIVKGQNLGEIRSGDPTALAATFLSCIQGIAEILVVRPNMVLPEKDWILDILRKR